MKSKKVSQTYAKALFLAAKEKNALELVKEELEFFVDYLKKSKDLYQSLTAKCFSVQSKVQIVKEIGIAFGLSSLVLKFLELLASKDRMGFLFDIVTVFESLIDESKNVLRGELVIADEISDSEKQELERVFSKKFNKQVLLNKKINKSILGGLVVNINGVTFDGSLKTTLKRIQEKLERQTI
jgi:F-type H+-transporting ATPase subunit delta